MYYEMSGAFVGQPAFMTAAERSLVPAISNNKIISSPERSPYTRDAKFINNDIDMIRIIPVIPMSTTQILVEYNRRIIKITE